MKKHFITLALLMPLMASAYETWTDPNTGIQWTYTLHNGSISLGGESGRAVSVSTSGELVVPPTIKGRAVTSIGSSAFLRCSGLKSVTIPNGVTSISGYAFAECCGLVSVTIPSSVTSIGESAFAGCERLASVIISSSVTSIGNNAFYRTPFYENQPDGMVILGGGVLYKFKGECPLSVTIPQGVTSISDYAFKGCRGLVSVTIPFGVMSIGDFAFSCCYELESVTIPSSVTSIGCDAFADAPFYENQPDGMVILGGGVLYKFKGECPLSVTIPEGVTSIGGGAFCFCSELKAVTIPPSVVSIGGAAFQDCIGLTEVSIPSNVTTISDWAFYGCSGLESLTIPSSVTNIGECAFEGCYGLTEVTIPSSVTSIGSGAFGGCELKSWTSAYMEEELMQKIGMGGVESVVICQGVTTISDWAFNGAYCYGLTKVTIPSSVTSIGKSAFYGCYGLTEVTIPSSVTSIGSGAFEYTPFYENQPDGMVILGGGVLYRFKGECPLSVTIPKGVTSISDYAFDGRYELESVTIPFGVTSIGDSAFSYCSELKSVLIPPSVIKLGAAFSHCEALTSLVIPKSVECLDVYTFGGCSNLKDLYFQGEPPKIVNECGYKVVYLGNPTLWADVVYRKTGDDVCIHYNAKYTQQWLPVLEACGIENAEPYVCAEVIVVGEKAEIDTGFVGYTAKGLPSGLKYNKTTGKITGAAKTVTAKEGVVVKFTKSGAADEEMTIVVRAEEISVGCAGLSSGPLPAGVAGTAGGMDIQIGSEGGTKSVSVTKLPAGMKYDSKSGKITGAPTKAGEYEVVLTVTTMYGNKEIVKIPVSVAAMPVMAVGKFDGFVSVGGNDFGTFTLTTTDAGKLTAKVITAAGTVSFSGTCWDSVEDGVYRAALTAKKGETLTLTLDSNAAWDADQLSGGFRTANGRELSVSAQRNAFGKTWYFSASGNEAAGWTLAYTEDTKGAALTVTLKADGSTSIAGKLPNGTDTKGKAVTLKVSASGYANVGGLREGAVIADFAPILTINKVKKALAIKANLWFDRKNDHPEGVGEARIVE